jgi:hypothetical protein
MACSAAGIAILGVPWGIYSALHFGQFASLKHMFRSEFHFILSACCNIMVSKDTGGDPFHLPLWSVLSGPCRPWCSFLKRVPHARARIFCSCTTVLIKLKTASRWSHRVINLFFFAQEGNVYMCINFRTTILCQAVAAASNHLLLLNCTG